MCDRKYIFGDKSTFGWNQNGHNMPKKGQKQKNIFLYIKQGSITHTFNVKRFTFYILFEN